MRMLGRAFPHVAVASGTPHRTHVVHIRVDEWSSREFDVFALDVLLNECVARAAVELFIDGANASAPSVARVACEVLTHYQRFVPRRNDRDARFDEVLARHRAAHDLSKPLVAADYAHALDVWQWVLRLEPTASIVLQAAALFHDVERLQSEADVRIEHTARDYQAFKDAHAAVGARMVRDILAGVLSEDELDRIAVLIHKHERPRDDHDLIALNDADALSFFSINACGFIRYYGEAHTRKKIAYTLARLSPRGLRCLRWIRLREDLRVLLDERRSAA